MRVNAGLAMARIIEMVQGVAMDNQPGAVGGVGQVFFSPNSRNVLPGKVVFTVDIRSPDKAKLDAMRATIEAEAPKICEALGVGCSIEAIGHFDPVTFDPTLVDGGAQRCGEAGLQPHEHHLRRRPRRLLGQPRSHRRPWSCAPASAACRTTRPKTSPRNGPTAGADVLFHAVVETAEIVE